jgi:hypothetical protein
MDNNVWVAIFTSPAVVAGIIGLATTVLGYLAVKLRSWLEARLGKEKLQSAIMMTEVIASGVEQVAGRFGWDSKSKLDQAVSRLREWAKKQGIIYTDEQWQMIVERTVLALSKTWQELKGSTSISLEAKAVHDSY